MLLEAALRLWGLSYRPRFERACADPALAQTQLLHSLLRRNGMTAFGREHEFASIHSLSEYATRVPVRDYEGFRPYVDRIVAGETGVLTRDPVTMFTTTSGTTGAPKLIPVTEAWRQEVGRLARLALLRAMRDHPGLLRGKVLSIVSPAIEGYTAGGIPIGSMSGVTQRSLTRLVRRQITPAYEVALIPDPDMRYFLTMRLALGENVSFVATPNASTLLRLAETAATHGDEIVEAVARGTLGIPPFEGIAEPVTGHGDLVARLEGGLHPNPTRARELEAVLREHGRLLPGACWPALAMIGCWLGGGSGVHAQRLAQHYGERPMRDLGFLASEGSMSVPVEDGTPAGALAVHSTYFEFIRESEIEEPSPATLGAAELQEGERYYVLLTGGNGLYRYDINDVVEVRGFYRRAPRIAFVRKGRDMLSITGEKLHLNHVQDAIQQAKAATGWDVFYYRLIPDVEDSRYELLVEPAGPAPSGSRFLTQFDTRLGAVNQEYAAKRASGRLHPPLLHVMRRGWGERLCREDFRAGKRDNQHKWVVMTPQWDEQSRQDVERTIDSGNLLRDPGEA